MLRGPEAPTTSADHHQIALPLLLNGFCIAYISLQKLVSFSAFQITVKLRGECASSSPSLRNMKLFPLCESLFHFKGMEFCILLLNTFSFLIQNHYIHRQMHNSQKCMVNLKKKVNFAMYNISCKKLYSNSCDTSNFLYYFLYL